MQQNTLSISAPQQFKQEEVFPSFPPDYIFKNRKARTAPSVDVAKKYITYLYDRIDYVKGEGIFYYYKGVKLPRKGIPFAQAVYSINPIKRMIANLLRIFSSKEIMFFLIGFIFTPKRWKTELLNKSLNALIEIADLSMAPYYFEEGYYCKTAKEIRIFLRTFLISMGIDYAIADKVGEIGAMIMEFDDAYRYRFQDIVSESTLEKLLTDFPKEITRLVPIFLEREKTGNPARGVPQKFKNFIKILKILWWIPSIRKAVKKGLKAVNYLNWILDEADIFQNLLYADYNMQGKPLEERQKIYMALYGNDESKAPLRVEVMINNT